MVKDALKYLDELADDEGNSPSLQRELAAAYLKVGDVQGRPYRANLGDTQGALRSYRKALAILEELVKADAKDVESRRELSVAHENIGLIQARAYQWIEAIESQRAAMEIREELVASSPGGAGFRSLLSDSYFNFADAMMFSAVRFDSERALENDRIALENYRKSLSIREALSDGEPANMQLRRDIAQSYQRIGIVMLAMFDNSGMRTPYDPVNQAEYLRSALESHDKSLAIRKDLLVAQPASAQARRDLADEYVMRCDAQVRSADFHSALEGYRQALPIFESLVAADPTNAEARHDLALAYQSISPPLGNYALDTCRIR